MSNKKARTLGSDLRKLRRRLVKEHNARVAYYNKGKKIDRWDGCNPEDRDAHGRECGYINGLAFAIDRIEDAIDAVEGKTDERPKV